MVNPLGPCNLAGHSVAGLADLGFTTPMTQNTTQTSGAMQEMLPCDLFLVVQFTAATVSVNCKIQKAATAAAAVAFAAPQLNQAVANSSENTLHLPLDSANLFWAVRLVENNISAPAITELRVLSIAQAQLGTSPVSLEAAKAAMASLATPNAGSGLLTLTP